MKHITFTTKHITFTTSKWLQMRIAVFFLLCLLCICLPTHSHAQTTRKKWKALKAKADTLEKYGKYEDALPLRIQEKDLALQKWGKWSKEYGTGAYDLGMEYYFLGETDSALIFINDATDVRKNIFGENNIDYANSLNTLGKIFFEIEKFDKGLALTNESFIIRGKRLGKKHPQTLMSLNNIAAMYQFLCKYDTALILSKQCLKLREEVLGKEHPETLMSLGNLASLYASQEKYDTAVSLTLNYLVYYREVKNRNYVLALANLADLYSDMGKNTDALIATQECLSLIENAIDRNDKAFIEVLTIIANVYNKSGRYQNAIKLHNKCLELLKTRVNSKFKEAKNLNGLSVAYKNIGEYNLAILFAKETLIIIEDVLGMEVSDYATQLSLIGDLYIDIGNYKEAILYHQQSLVLHKKMFGKNSYKYISSLASLGECYDLLGKYDELLSLEQEYSQIMKEIKLNDDTYMIAINDLAVIQTTLGKNNAALNLLEEAVKIDKRKYEQDKMSLAVLYNLALLYEGMCNYPQALILFHQYLDLHKVIFPEDYSKSDINVFTNLGIIYWKTSIYKKSHYFLLQAYAVTHKHYQQQSWGMTESDRTQFWATLKDNYETYHSFCLDAKDSIPEVVAQAYNNQLNTAGILLQGTEKVKQAIQSSGDSSLLQLYETWRIQKKQIANWATWDSLRLANSGIDLKVEAEKANDWEQELARKSVEFREATDTTAITWQEVQQSLQAGEAAVEIVRFRKYNHDFTDTVYYAALVLTPETKENPIYVFLPNGNKMDSLWFKKYREYIDRHNPNYPLKTEDTISYVRYLKPILAACGNVKHIYFAADGVYHKLNFNTLWTEQGQYVAQQWQIHQLSSTRELVKKHREIPVSTQFTAALFGNPTFDMNKTEWLQTTSPYHQTENISTFRGGLEGDREENLKALPGAEAEVEAIGELLKNKGFEVKSYLNKMALEEEVQALKSPTIVLFATHGSFQKKASLPKSTGYNIANDPMYQSVLFFAGAKNTLSDSLSLENILATPQHEDGILHAAEAANLRLEGTELVVLSACETGLGQIQNGEGVYGLQRAFRIAGAKDLLMSLWKVDDQASKEFTTLFFQNWIDKKMSKYEAYRSIQLTLIQKYPYEPKKWGAFVLKESGR